MEWWRRLETELEAIGANYAKVSRACGFRDARVHEIVKMRMMPNAADAVKLCRFLGLTVEEVFGAEPEPHRAGVAVPAIRQRAVEQVEGEVERRARAHKRRADRARKTG